MRLQQAFEGRANARAQERRGEIERELSELDAQLSVLTGRKDEIEQQGRGDPINMSSSGMSDKELEAIGELVASEDFMGGRCSAYATTTCIVHTCALGCRLLEEACHSPSGSGC